MLSGLSDTYQPQEEVSMLKKNWEIRRGDLYLVDLNPFTGSEQGGKRPIVIVSNNIGNKYAPTVIVAPLTTQPENGFMPTHVHIHKAIYSSTADSTVLTEQIKTIDKKRLVRYLGKLSSEQMRKVDIALLISFGLISSHIVELRDAAVAILRKRWKENRRRKGEHKHVSDDGCIGIGTGEEETESDGSAGSVRAG